MSSIQRIFLAFSLSMLLLAMAFGAVASFAFLYPEFYNAHLPFYQLRPMHVSAALFWIISGAAACLLFFRKEAFEVAKASRTEVAFIYTWMASVIAVFIFYSFRRFGGREYWEFPPVLGVPIVIAWGFLIHAYFRDFLRKGGDKPLYIWMWTTGLVFFLITFLEQNLYQIPWFRASFLREVTVQWKSNGAMVGAWNQMIYGSSLFLMVKLSGDKQIAQSRKAFFFYFLGLTNLMFNWGHHIYNVPGASWIRHVSYAVSMTEWIILVSILRSFREKMDEERKYRHILVYRFLIAAECWVFLNLILALMMSIPAVNRYTHGTHITVAHAMGATIGINTMILLACIGYIIRIDKLPLLNQRRINAGFAITHLGLLVFWIALIVAGVVKGYRNVALQIDSFQQVMVPVYPVLKLFSAAGVVMLIGMSVVVLQYMTALRRGRHSKVKQAVRIKAADTYGESLIQPESINL